MSRRRRTDRLPVGRDGELSLWVETSRPGIHFHVQDENAPYTISGRWMVHEQGLVLAELLVTSQHPNRPRGLSALASPRGTHGWSSSVLPVGSSEPPPHISGSALRSVSVAELERRTRKALKEGSADEERSEEAMTEAGRQGIDIPALYRVPRTVSRDLLRQVGEGSFRPGRQGYPFDLYRWIATEYLRLVRKTNGRRILPELAKAASGHLGRDVSVSNVRDWVHRARELGLLSEGRQGSAYAEPGPALSTGRS
jgi:hypothetical protein